jgi:pyridinium-3,5-biscarboxylic acid mononucleotide sulfurtransferase
LISSAESKISENSTAVPPSPVIDYASLREWFSRFPSALVAFSGGVDSSVLAYAAHDVLSQRSVAVTSISPAFARSELDSGREVANEIGIELLEVFQDDLSDRNYMANQVSRCYFCRSNLVQAILPIAKERQISVCVDGTHIDDLKSPRPGVRALRESGFRAPFVESGLGKDRIREIAKMLGLSNWDRPSEACLSSRIAYGQEINEVFLRRIELAELSVREIVGAKVIRVRTIGDRAIIEVGPQSIKKAQASFSEIEMKLKFLGYGAVEIDPKGYSSGRMLELFLQSNE